MSSHETAGNRCSSKVETFKEGDFKYGTAIDSSELRVLTLHSNPDHDARLECELRTYPRDDKRTRYEALSYCWGKPHPTAPVTINGSSLKIREILASALRHLRLQYETRHLWVDALCINQDDKEEKSKQVLRMGETYRKASSVIVWLGEESKEDQSKLGMEVVHVLGSPLEHLGLNQVRDSTVRLPRCIGKSGPASYLSGMYQLLQREWFTRLWVVQEVCLAPAKQVTMVCGHDTAPFWALGCLQLASTDTSGLLLSTDEAMFVNPYQHMMKMNPHEPPLILTRHLFAVTSEEAKMDMEALRRTNCTLLVHLIHFRERECQDPRDRIHALRSLAYDVHGTIEPNYKEEVAETFAAATHALIRYHENLDVLSLCQGPESLVHAGEEYLEKQRPSWAPDYHRTPRDQPIRALTMYMPGNKPYYTATLVSRAIPELSSDHLQLTVSGYEVGVIDALAPFGADDLQRRNSLLQSWNLVRTLEIFPDPTYHDRKDVFWRTLITNRTSESNLAEPDREGIEFDHFWEFTKHPTEHTGADLLLFPNYNKAFSQHGFQRCFFTSQNGFVGLAPAIAKVKDCICLLSGAQVPFVLRKAEGQLGWQVIGESYVHGLMNGEHWRRLTESQQSRSTFVLV